MGAKGEGRDFRPRLFLAAGVVVVVFLVLTGRLYQVQVAKGEHYTRLSRSNFVKRIDIPADRGMILDRRGKIVVDGRPSYDLEITPVFSLDPIATVDRLVEALNLDDNAVERAKERINAARGLERFRSILVQRDIGRDELDWFESNRIDFDGVDVQVRPRRNYRYGSHLAHVLGYMNEIGREELARSREAGLDYRLGDMLGRSGIEERFERWLRGKDGIEQVVVDAKGRRTQLGEDNASLIPPDERILPSVPGHNLVLTIDMALQQVAEASFPGLAGSVVAIDPRTGYVLAMMSRPSFDPNKLSGRISVAELRDLSTDHLQPLINRTIQQHYPPGSTFKVATALAAIQTGTVSGPQQGTNCPGGYRLGRRTWRCWRDAGHGFIDLRRSLKHSCDTYYYWVADRMGIDPIAKWARQLGFGQTTGIGLSHEIPGIMPDVQWYRDNHPDGYQRGFALNASIGQGDVNATSLQVAIAYAALANGGVVYKPQLVQRIEDVDGNIIEEFPPEERWRIDVKPETLKAINEALWAVVHEPGGTAFWRRPRDLDVQIAGKTGTSQVVRIGAVRVRHEDKEYEHRNHAMFAAFAPLEDPEIVVAVVHEHGGSGGRDAAPAAFAVLQGYFNMKEKEGRGDRHQGILFEQFDLEIDEELRSLATDSVPCECGSVHYSEYLNEMERG